MGERRGAGIDLLIWAVAVLAPMVAVAAFGLKVPGGDLGLKIAAPLQMLLLFGVTTWVIRRRGETWGDLGLRRPPGAWRTLQLILGGYVSVIAINAVLVLLVYPRLHLDTPQIGALGPLKGDLGAYLYWLTFAWISAAIGEELQFRGFLRSRIEILLGGGRGAMVGALVAQAAVFGAAHAYQGVSGVMVTTVAGLVLGTVFLLGRRSLVPGMLLHALIDTVSLTAVFAGVIPTMPK